MGDKLSAATQTIMNERFNHDTLLAVATMDEHQPSVRTVNSYYEDGVFYVITYALSAKMKQITVNPRVAVCGERFSAHGIAENIGFVGDPDNRALMIKLRAAFASWYCNGHVDEDDVNTCILRIKLTDGVLFDHGSRYDIDFTAE